VGEIAQAFDGAEAIETTEVGVEIEVLEFRGILGGQLQGIKGLRYIFQAGF